MNYIGFLKESTIGSLNSIWSMAKVIVPLMIIIEFLKNFKVLDKISELLKPIANFFGISDEAIFPLVIGLILGLSYGAGIIIDSAKEDNLPKKDLYILIIFLIACHSIFEDTLVFVTVGANGVFLLTMRIGVAIIISFIASKIFDKLIIDDENSVEEIQ